MDSSACRNYHHHIVNTVDRLISAIKQKGSEAAVNIADIAQVRRLPHPHSTCQASPWTQNGSVACTALKLSGAASAALEIRGLPLLSAQSAKEKLSRVCKGELRSGSSKGSGIPVVHTLGVSSKYT